MNAPAAELAVPLPLAIVVVLGTIAVLAYAIDALERRRRRGARRERLLLAERVMLFLDGSLEAEALRRAVERADEGTCWTALESLVPRIKRPAWLRLSLALARCRHADAERRALDADSPWRRVLAARRLSLLRSRPSWRALRRAMARGPEMVTLAAGTALARYRDRGALRWILAHPDAIARRSRNALAGLLAAFGRSGLPVLAEALSRGDSLPRLELALVDALGAGRYLPARAPIEHRLATGELDIRVAAARALGLMAAEDSVTLLTGALSDDAWQVRAQAARALGRIQAPFATPALARGLTDASWWVRHHSAYALMDMGEDGRAALRQITASSPDRYAREMAREALEGGIRRMSA